MTELSNSMTELSNSIRELFMCTIREHTNSFAALCNWIWELSYSIKELSITTNSLQYENIKVCLWNTDYAPGGNKVQKSYF